MSEFVPDVIHITSLQLEDFAHARPCKSECEAADLGYFGRLLEQFTNDASLRLSLPAFENQRLQAENCYPLP